MRSPAAVALLCLALAGAVQAAAIPQRTERVSVASSGAAGNGSSSRPTIDRAGTTVAFESSATTFAEDANGPVRDVFRRDLASGTTVLVSRAATGGAADGPSEEPVIAMQTRDIAFSSRATNLVAGDANGVRDVFLARPDGALARVSVPAAGGEAIGPSYQPDVSVDGRRVVFTSLADNLVPGDDNGVEDVFVRDLAAGVTWRVSERDGRSFKGRSRAPAISPDGRWVTFESTASDVVPADRNKVADVFLADLDTRRIVRVSVSSSERAQNRAVVNPFVTISDVSADGRYVVWDSDATNLVRRDRNRDTDVFLRDVRSGRTELVSRTVGGRPGDNDSYLPVISEGGRYVTFSSFAGNFWPSDPAGEDVFLHDRARRVSTPLSVTSGGRRRGPEATRQLLRRAHVSEHGRRAVFTSTARLVRGDGDAFEDVHLRRTDPPRGRIVEGPSGTTGRRPRYRLDADDPAAVFLCRVDDRPRYFCPRAGRLPRLSRGSHRFSVQAGGPGMLFEARRGSKRFRVR